MARQSDGTVALADYQLIPIDGSLEEDPATARWIEQAKEEVEENYLSDFGLTFDQVLEMCIRDRCWGEWTFIP